MRQCLIILLLLVCHLLAAHQTHAQSLKERYAVQPKAPEPVISAPFIFEASRVMFHRESVKRTGWNESTIRSQLPQAQNTGDEIWRNTITAALLGDADLLRQTVDQLNQHLAQEPAESPYFSLTQILQSYDCMQALPEWSQVEAESRNALQSNLIRYCDSLFNSEQKDPSPAEKIVLQTSRLLAGILVDSATHVQASLEGTENSSPLHKILLNNTEGEGLLKQSPLNEHLNVVNHILPAAAALKAASPSGYQRYQPLFQTPLDILAELSYPDGQMPGGSAEKMDRYHFARALERGLPLFAEKKYAFLLQSLYEHIERPVEALLYGMQRENQISSRTFESVFYPRTGATLLHDHVSDIPFSVFLDSGISSRQDSPHLLSLDLLTPKGRLSSQAGNVGSAGYNTVLIDGKSHETYDAQDAPKNALLRFSKQFQNQHAFYYAFADNRLSNRSPYTGSITPPLGLYERAVYMSSPYVVDMFRVHGGSRHDYIYHSAGSFESSSLQEWKPFSVDGDDLELLKRASNLRSIETSGVYSIRFSQPDSLDVSERLWFIDPVGSRLIAGNIDGHSFVVVRREEVSNVGNVFTAIHEVIQNQAPDINIELLPLSPPPNERGYQAQAFAVHNGPKTDLFISSLNTNTEYAANYQDKKLVFSGYFGHVNLEAGVFQSLRLAGGKKLRYDTHGAEFDGTQVIGTIRMVDPLGKKVYTDFLPPLPVGGILDRQTMIHLPSDIYTVNYQPLPIQALQEHENPQILELQNPIDLTSPETELAPPMKAGDQLIVDNVAELVYQNNDQYNLFSSSLATFLIDGGEDNNQVIFKPSVLKRVRGESLAGAIQFSVEPKEFHQGPATIKRVK